MNQRIRAREIRVIDDEGNQVGVMDPREALTLAQEKNLDLVEISPTAQPPVCRILDYGKYLYELNKKMHEQRKHQKGLRLKEVKIRPRTDQHDYEFKRNHVIRFLEEGDKVKLVMIFRGREMAHVSLAKKKYDKLIEEVSEFGTPEKRPSMEGRAMIVILVPKPQPKKQKPARAKQTSSAPAD